MSKEKAAVLENLLLPNWTTTETHFLKYVNAECQTEDSSTYLNQNFQTYK